MEDFRRGVERVLRSTGAHPRPELLVPAPMWDRVVAYFAEQRGRTREGSGTLASYLET